MLISQIKSFEMEQFSLVKGTLFYWNFVQLNYVGALVNIRKIIFIFYEKSEIYRVLVYIEYFPLQWNTFPKYFYK